MSYNLVVVDDDEVIFLFSMYFKGGLQDSPKTFNSAHKALTFFDSLSNDESILLFWTLTCLLWMAGDY
jgi:hypothetical protein